MDLQSIILREAGQTETDTIRYCLYQWILQWILKNDTNKLIYKSETDSQKQNTGIQLPKEMQGGINWKSGIKIDTLHYYI